MLKTVNLLFQILYFLRQKKVYLDVHNFHLRGNYTLLIVMLYKERVHNLAFTKKQEFTKVKSKRLETSDLSSLISKVTF